MKSIVKEAGFVDKEDDEYKSDEKMKKISEHMSNAH